MPPPTATSAPDAFHATLYAIAADCRWTPESAAAAIFTIHIAAAGPMIRATLLPPSRHAAPPAMAEIRRAMLMPLLRMVDFVYGTMPECSRRHIAEAVAGAAARKET